MALTVENLPAMRETWVQSLGVEDPLEEGMATHSQYSCLENPHGEKSLACCSPWGCKESEMTERLSIFTLALQGRFSSVQSLSRVRLFATPGTIAHQAPLSMGFSRQEYWCGLPYPPPEDLPDPGIKPRSPALQADSLPSEPRES